MTLKLYRKLRALLNLNHEVRNLTNEIQDLNAKISILNTYDDKNIKINFGKLMSDHVRSKPINQPLHNYEFQVYSQWGDDGIIQYLISNIDIPNKTFIEFGVENYVESNTRFLLMNDNWTGLVMDGSKENIEYIKRDIVFWKYDLHAHEAFITKENINGLLSKIPFEQEVGILSIDIDGNDYWVWNEIDVINPIIVIAEYNDVFGIDNPWTLPYKKDYVRKRTYPNMLYWGASYSSLVDLAQKKGYSLMGCNSNGNNIYFVRNDKLGNLKSLSKEAGYVQSKFREIDNPETGYPIYGENRLKSLDGFEVWNTVNNNLEKINV